MTDYKNQFEICVRAIIRSGNKILVCVGKKNGIYFFPGGHIEYGETAEAALKRELKEELNIRIKKASFMGTVENIYKEDGQTHHEINLVFDCSVDKIHSQSQEEHIDFTLLNKNEFARIKVLPITLHKNVMKWMKNKKMFWSSQAD